MTIQTIDITPLQELPKLAADYIRDHGWIQDEEQDEHGSVCLTGALRLCSPVPGDGYVAREVFRFREHAEYWNDSKDRTADEVIDYLASTEITDVELAEVFGPQWREIVALVRQIASATPDQITSLNAARDAARGASWDAAWGAAWGAARGAAQEAAAWSTAEPAAWGAARSATIALSTRDLIGTGTYAQGMYDRLSAAYVSVFGALHPDDVK